MITLICRLVILLRCWLLLTLGRGWDFSLYTYFWFSFLSNLICDHVHFVFFMICHHLCMYLLWGGSLYLLRGRNLYLYLSRGRDLYLLRGRDLYLLWGRDLYLYLSWGRDLYLLWGRDLYLLQGRDLYLYLLRGRDLCHFLYLFPGGERRRNTECTSCPHWAFICKVKSRRFALNPSHFAHYITAGNWLIAWIGTNQTVFNLVLLKGWAHHSGSRVADQRQDSPAPPRAPFPPPCTHRSLSHVYHPTILYPLSISPHFAGLCYVPSSTSPASPLPTTSLCHALALASQLAKVTKDVSRLPKVGEWTLCNPPHHHFQCHGWQLLLNLFLHFTLSQCNDLWAGERTRGDGGNHWHSSHWWDWNWVLQYTANVSI